MDQFTTLKKWGGKYGVRLIGSGLFLVIEKEKRQPGIENCMQKKYPVDLINQGAD